MTSKQHRHIRTALALAVTGSLALSANAWSQAVHKAEVAGAAASPAQVAAGKTVFETACMACHQADGKGLPGAFPPLAGSDFLLGNTDRAVGIVVNGLQGEVVVNGNTFNSVMPAMTQLSDTEIADALGISEVNARQILFEARRKMRARLGDAQAPGGVP